MNPLTDVENLNKLNEREIQLGISGTKSSWHDVYKDSAWIFVGGLSYDLTEGDVICVFSQYGEIVNINMVRDKKTGKIKGYGFICYEDQRSTVLAVDNLNGIKLLGRTIKVDHVKDYRPPDADDKNIDDVTKLIRKEGVAPRPLTPSEDESDDDDLVPQNSKGKKKKKKHKKDKSKKKERKMKEEITTKEELKIKEEPKIKTEPTDHSTDAQRKINGDNKSYESRGRGDNVVNVKTERADRGYDKYAHRDGLRVRERSQDRSRHSSPPFKKLKSDRDRYSDNHKTRSPDRIPAERRDRSRRRSRSSIDRAKERERRKSRSPRKHSRSPRRYSRSPRRYSRSPRRHSRERTPRRDRSRDRHRR